MHLRTILGTALSANYEPDIQWFAVHLNQLHEHTSACAGGFLAEKHRLTVSRWVTNSANRYKEGSPNKGEARERLLVEGLV